MNIFPKNVFKGKNSDGTTFTVKEWDYMTLMQLEGASFFVTLVTAFILSAFAPPLLLLISIFTINGRVKVSNIVGIIIGVYFLYDAYHNWLGMASLNLVFDKTGITNMVALNIAALIGNVLFFIFNGVIYRWVLSDDDKRDSRIIIYFTIAFFTVLFSFMTVGKSLAPTIAKERFELIKSWDEKAKANDVDWHDACKGDNWHN